MNKPSVTSILLAGVGGQGIVTSSDILAEACFRSGFSVKKSEVHGMAQRGGSVLAQVRFSQTGEVFSPLIPAGQVDLLIGFELLEALRQIDWLRPGGRVITDDMRIEPLSVAAGEGRYPPDAAQQMRRRAQLLVVPGDEIARRAGDPRTRGVAVLGAASTCLPLDLEAWEQALAFVLPAKAVECNLIAFRLGREFAQAQAPQATAKRPRHRTKRSGPQ